MKPKSVPDNPDSGWQEVGRFVTSGFHGDEDPKRKRTTVSVQKPKFASSGHYGEAEQMPRRVQQKVEDVKDPSLLDFAADYFKSKK